MKKVSTSASSTKPTLLRRGPGPVVGVPLALLALYFLHSFAASFPMTAYGKWLFDVIHMPPATTTIYYSVGFFPWNLKPLYGLISDNFPIAGYHRKSYIALCEVGAALAMLVTGLLVSTIAGAFLMKLIEAVCEAFAQIMLGIFLVDLASNDATSTTSARVQSWANGAKNGASILALFLGIPLYRSKTVPPGEIISGTSVLMFTAAIVCIMGIREVRQVVFPLQAGGDLTALEAQQEPRHSVCSTMQQAWQDFKEDTYSKLRLMKPVLPTMMFFLLCSALPNDEMVWYQYTYSLLKDELECMQYASLAGMVGRFLSCIMYAKLCSGRNVRSVFLVSTICSVLAGLPRLMLTPPMADLPVSVCTFSSAETFLTSFTSEFALLQLLVVATHYVTPQRDLHGLTYALYLSFMDFGGVLSGFFTSLVVSALGITTDETTYEVNWDKLWILVVIASCGQLLVLAFLSVLPKNVPTTSYEWNSTEEQEPLLPASETRA